jgi:hypothetical protein
MNTNWRTNIGGSLGLLGDSLLGIGIIPQVAGLPSKWLTGIALAGFFIRAIGSALGHFLGADAKVVAVMGAAVKQNTAAIAAIPQAITTGDTSIITKAMVQPTVNPPLTPTVNAATLPPVGKP